MMYRVFVEKINGEVETFYAEDSYAVAAEGTLIYWNLENEDILSIPVIQIKKITEKRVES